MAAAKKEKLLYLGLDIDHSDNTISDSCFGPKSECLGYQYVLELVLLVRGTDKVIKVDLSKGE